MVSIFSCRHCRTDLEGTAMCVRFARNERMEGLEIPSGLEGVVDWE